MYEFAVVFLVALLFIIVYFVGTRRNRKIAVQYAKAVKEHMSPLSEFVGFRPYSRGGFRALCKPKEKGVFTQVEMAVSLVDRENLMHYPLSLLTKDRDRLACWGFLKNPISFDLEILPKSDGKLCQKIAIEKNLKEVAAKNELDESFAFLTSDQSSAHRFLSGLELEKRLLGVKDSIRRLSLSRKETRIYLIGELQGDLSIRSLADILIWCGEQCSR